MAYTRVQLRDLVLQDLGLQGGALPNLTSAPAHTKAQVKTLVLAELGVAASATTPDLSAVTTAPVHNKALLRNLALAELGQVASPDTAAVDSIAPAPVHSRVMLRDLILVELGVIATGETPTVDDANLVTAALDRLHARLLVRGVNNWTADTVPGWAARPYVLIGANDLAASFGLGDPRRAELAAAASAAESELRQLAATELLNGVLERLHARLLAAGLAGGWTLETVPGWAAQGYILGAAADAASSLGASEARTAELMARASAAETGLRPLVAASHVDGAIDRIHARWAGRGLADWTTAAIPAWAVDSYVVTVAAIAAASIAPDRRADLVALSANAENELRVRAGAALIEGVLVRLHARWAVRMPLIKWTIDTVPEEAADSYVIGAGAMAASRFPIDPMRRRELLEMVPEAERELRRLISLPYDGYPTRIEDYPDPYGIEDMGDVVGNL